MTKRTKLLILGFFFLGILVYPAIAPEFGDSYRRLCADNDDETPDAGYTCSGNAGGCLSG